MRIPNLVMPVLIVTMAAPCVIERLQTALDETRLAKIRDWVTNLGLKESLLQYKVPWFDAGVLEKESVDLIYSQAVLEHVDDLRNTYKSMRMWLKSDGYMSHQIDYKCHGVAAEWNGHWKYSDLIWKLIRGGRPFLINREPHATHIELLNDEGFKILLESRNRSESKYSVHQLEPRFRSISQDDLTTSGAFIQVAKTV
jgi:hypothetical protein